MVLETSGLTEYPQFILWQIGIRDGKEVKLPIDGKTGKVCDPTDPASWLDYTYARQLSAKRGDQAGAGIGFVFTAADPFWFLDIDKCVVEGEWSELATQLMATFPQAFIEVSNSNAGLHIIGSGDYTEHTSRNGAYGLEFYTQQRFVALTGTGAQGDARTDYSHALPWLIESFFPPIGLAERADWTDRPTVDWAGPEDDDELIAAMLRSKSAAGLFGASATVQDLWNADPDALGLRYPDSDAGRAYNASDADAALCLHLAFWTGKDCERVDRLMRRSGLYRDKWEREDYRYRTIINAVSLCSNVYKSPKLLREQSAIEWQERTGEPVNAVAMSGPEIVPFESRPDYFRGHYFLTRHARVFCPDGVTRSKDAYNAMYGNREFSEAHGSKPITDPWKAYITAPDVRRVEVYDTAYRPEYQAMAIFPEGGRYYVNEYLPTDGARVEGDAEPFINHVKTILPHGRDAEVLLSWMAALVQFPGKKFYWAPLVQGVEGNGKSLLTRVLTYALGEDHVEDVNPEELLATGGKFNAWIKSRRLALIEEIKTENHKRADSVLKRMIVQGRIQVQAKGVDQITTRTCCNFFLTTNYKDAVPINDATRRYAPLFCAQQHESDLSSLGMHREGDYFARLFRWLDHEQGWAKAANFLDHYQIPAEFNPAGAANKAPRTSVYGEAIEESMSAGLTLVEDELESGAQGTLGGWVSKKVMHNRVGDKVSLKMIGTYLEALGYRKHRALPYKGRASRPIMAEGGARSVLYVKEGSPDSRHIDGGLATAAYIRAQGYDEGVKTQGLKLGPLTP